MTATNQTGGGHRSPSDCTYSTVSAAFAEEQLELAISAASARMCSAPTRDGKLIAWRELVQLIDQRSPSRVRFMERMRGLR